MCFQVERAVWPAAPSAEVSGGAENREDVGTGSQGYVIWYNPRHSKETCIDSRSRMASKIFNIPFHKVDEQPSCKQLTEGCFTDDKQANTCSFFCSFSLSSIVFLKMLRLQKIYSSPFIGTTFLTQMVPLFSGLLFSPQNTSAPPLPFFVSDFLQTLLLSLSQGHIFLPPEGRYIRVSSFVPPNTLFTHFYYSLFLFLTSISLLVLPSTPDFNSLPN